MKMRYSTMFYTMNLFIEEKISLLLFLSYIVIPENKFEFSSDCL